METLDIQSKIRERKAPMARVKCAQERDNRTFGELIEWLNEAGGVRHQAPRRASSLSHLGSSQLRNVTPKTGASVFSLRHSATTYSALCSRSPILKSSAHGGRAERCSCDDTEPVDQSGREIPYVCAADGRNDSGHLPTSGYYRELLQ